MRPEFSDDPEEQIVEICAMLALIDGGGNDDDEAAERRLQEALARAAEINAGGDEAREAFLQQVSAAFPE